MSEEKIDWSSLHKILSDTTRRGVLELLSEKKAEPLGYTEIMTLLGVTNTGRLNYHLKVLNDLISKDERGKYHLTERGQLAVNLLRTFPERVSLDEKKSQQLRILKIAVSAILILIGIALILGGVLALAASPVSVDTTEHFSISSQLLIPQNTTVSLPSWSVALGSSQSVAWSASSPIDVYLLNSTQYGTLLSRHSSSVGPAAGALPTRASLQNFTGAPNSWVRHYYLQSGNVSLSLPPGQYYPFAGTGTQQKAILETFGVTQKQPQVVNSSSSQIIYLPMLILSTLGLLLIILATLILTRRVWR